MKIDSAEQLEAIVKLCRKLNVESIEIDGVKLKLGDAPKRTRKVKETQGEIENPDAISDEQMLFWSSN